MAEKRYTRTYIREWRKKKGLSLRRLADRLELDGPHDTLSHASLGRIENGEQPYSQPILEAIAQALDCTVLDLLSRDPSKEGEVIFELQDQLAKAEKSKRDEIIGVVKVLLGKVG